MRLDSEKVRWHRDRLGWTLDTLAEQAEVAEGTALRAEHGEDIRPSSGRRIARAFGVDISELVPDKPGVVLPKATAPPSPPPREEEERRTDWDTALRSARQLQEHGRTRTEELLTLWRESKERAEDPAGRRVYLDEIGELLQRAYDAVTALWNTMRTHRLDLLDLDEFAEVQAADRFYADLFRLVQRAELSILIDGAQQGEPAQVGQLATHTVEESEAA